MPESLSRITPPPHPFDAVVGQPKALRLLQAALQRDRVAPGYLFAGASGTGRSLVALAFAELLLADRRSRDRVRDRNHPDLLWVEPTYTDKGKLIPASEAKAAGVERRTPPQIRLEQVRAIAEFVSRPPLESDRAVVVIEDADTMAEAAANGLLKTLEEPGHATLILIAASAGSILPTLVSRCQIVPFSRLADAEVREVLTRCGYGDISPAAIALAQGSPGTAIAARETLQAIPPDLIAALQIRPKRARDALALAKRVAKELDGELQLWLIDYLQTLLWQAGEPAATLHLLESAKQHLKHYVQPRLVWEVTLLEWLGDRDHAAR